MRIKHEARQVLNAFVGLFTQPFKQDINASLKGAVTAILLAMFPGLPLLLNGVIQIEATKFAAISLVLVLFWALLTAIFTKQDRRELAIARNLTILSFWIAATLVIVYLVNIIVPNPLDGALRRGVATAMLIPLIFIHMICNLPCFPALRVAFSLSISTVLLVWMVL